MNSKKLLAKKTNKGIRYYRNIGLGFKTPKDAIEGTYVDKKCPFTGNVSIRGRIIKYYLIYFSNNLEDYAFQQRCKEQLLLEEIIYILLRNTKDLKKDIRMFL